MGAACSSQKSASVKKLEGKAVSSTTATPLQSSEPDLSTPNNGAATKRGNSKKAMDATTVTVVFVRHGECEWNLENRFTGWVDVGLTKKGKAEAREAGKLLHEEGYAFDIAYTSVLKRAIRTCNFMLEEMDAMWIPVEKDFRLNERMFGALTGLNKQDTVGKDGVDVWGRSYDTPPPEAGKDHKYSPWNDPKYRHLQIEENSIPSTESLKTTLERVLPYWLSTIAPSAQEGKVVLVAAHLNSIRAILKYIDNIPNDVITRIKIPTGVPLVYTFNKATMQPIKAEGAATHLSGKYLVGEEEFHKKVQVAAN
eukprot:m.134530 g.134530  ORF g.134530 m.134530 type:complete len:310 (-) comp9626_c0_seq1:1231-2160(-)